MHPEQIKAELRMRGFTLDSVASRVTGRGRQGVSKSAVSRVIRGNLKSSPIARVICELLQKPANELWPKKYPALEVVPHEPRRQRRAA